MNYENFIEKYSKKILKEDIFSDRQKQIAIDTIKNPSKALLGGPSVEESKNILKTKFGYTDAMINKLQESFKEVKGKDLDNYTYTLMNYVNALRRDGKSDEEILKLFKKDFPNVQASDEQLKRFIKKESYKENYIVTLIIDNKKEDAYGKYNDEQIDIINNEMKKPKEKRLYKLGIDWSNVDSVIIKKESFKKIKETVDSYGDEIKVGDIVWNTVDRARGPGKIIAIDGNWITVDGWAVGKKKVHNLTIEKESYKERLQSFKELSSNVSYWISDEYEFKNKKGENLINAVKQKFNVDRGTAISMINTTMEEHGFNYKIKESFKKLKEKFIKEGNESNFKEISKIDISKIKQTPSNYLVRVDNLEQADILDINSGKYYQIWGTVMFYNGSTWIPLKNKKESFTKKESLTLDDVAQEKYGKRFKDLTPEEKKYVNYVYAEWSDDSYDEGCKRESWVKSPRYNTPDYTIYSNDDPKYSKFKDKFSIFLGRMGKSDEFYVSVTKEGREILNKEFKSFNDAENFAKQYMNNNKESYNKKESYKEKKFIDLSSSEMKQAWSDYEKETGKVATAVSNKNDFEKWFNKKYNESFKESKQVQFQKILSDDEIEKYCKTNSCNLIMASNKDNKTTLTVTESFKEFNKFDDVRIKSKNLAGMIYEISGNDVVIKTIKGLIRTTKDDLEMMPNFDEGCKREALNWARGLRPHEIHEINKLMISNSSPTEQDVKTLAKKLGGLNVDSLKGVINSYLNKKHFNILESYKERLNKFKESIKDDILRKQMSIQEIENDIQTYTKKISSINTNDDRGKIDAKSFQDIIDALYEKKSKKINVKESLKEGYVQITGPFNIPKTKARLQQLCNDFGLQMTSDGRIDFNDNRSLLKREINELLGELKNLGVSYRLVEKYSKKTLKEAINDESKYTAIPLIDEEEAKKAYELLNPNYKVKTKNNYIYLLDIDWDEKSEEIINELKSNNLKLVEKNKKVSKMNYKEISGSLINKRKSVFEDLKREVDKLGYAIGSEVNLSNRINLISRKLDLLDSLVESYKERLNKLNKK